MNFLEKLNYLMAKNNLNKSTLSKACDIPYTTIDGWYKKGYEGLKLTTLRKLSGFFGTSLDFWASDDNVDLPIQLSNKKLFAGERDEIQLLSDYRALNADTKTLARGMVKGLAISEKIANSKGETVGIPTISINQFADSLNKLEPEQQEVIVELIEELRSEQKDI